MQTQLTTGQLRRGSASLSPNPYNLYSTQDVINIGETIGVSQSHELVALRRQLRDAALTCIRYRSKFARDAAPSIREDWIRKDIQKPARALGRSIHRLEDPKNGYLQDLQQLLPQAESIGATRLFLKDLERRLLKLERLASAGIQDLAHDGQKLPKSKYRHLIVERFSKVYLAYNAPDTIGLNKRHTENSPYMQFIRKSAKPLIGYEHGLIDQMKKFRDSLGSAGVAKNSLES